MNTLRRPMLQHGCPCASTSLLKSQSSPITSCHWKELTSNLQQSDSQLSGSCRQPVIGSSGGPAPQVTLKQQVSCSKQLDPWRNTPLQILAHFYLLVSILMCNTGLFCLSFRWVGNLPPHSLSGWGSTDYEATRDIFFIGTAEDQGPW